MCGKRSIGGQHRGESWKGKIKRAKAENRMRAGKNIKIEAIAAITAINGEHQERGTLLVFLL